MNKQKKCVTFATNNKRIIITSKDKINYNILMDELKEEDISQQIETNEEHENQPESLEDIKVKAKIIKELKHTIRDINEMTIDAIDAEIQQFRNQTLVQILNWLTLTKNRYRLQKIMRPMIDTCIVIIVMMSLLIF